MTLSIPLDAEKFELSSRAGRVVCYASKSEGPGVPLLLVHSVNAAASAFEVRPLFDLYAGTRPVFALDLPGFGLSDRSDRAYTVRIMTDAILDVAAEIKRLHGRTVDAIALSLSCEFLGRAAVEEPETFRSLGFISPTGFEGKPRDKAGGTKGKAWLRSALELRFWSIGIWALLTTKPVIRKFLEKTWGSKNIDGELLKYDVETTHQAGARHAPYYFVSGYLSSKDILNVYGQIRQPVWMVYGIRGDFVDYHLNERVAHGPNWVIDVMPTGAFPHFEKLELLAKSYAVFASALP